MMFILLKVSECKEIYKKWLSHRLDWHVMFATQPIHNAHKNFSSCLSELIHSQISTENKRGCCIHWKNSLFTMRLSVSNMRIRTNVYDLRCLFVPIDRSHPLHTLHHFILSPVAKMNVNSSIPNHNLFTLRLSVSKWGYINVYDLRCLFIHSTDPILCIHNIHLILSPFSKTKLENLMTMWIPLFRT
jgi:hypothetical protein